VAHGPRNKPLDFGKYPDHVTLGSGLRLRLGGGAEIDPQGTLHGRMYDNPVFS